VILQPQIMKCVAQIPLRPVSRRRKVKSRETARPNFLLLQCYFMLYNIYVILTSQNHISLIFKKLNLQLFVE